MQKSVKHLLSNSRATIIASSIVRRNNFARQVLFGKNTSCCLVHHQEQFFSQNLNIQSSSSSEDLDYTTQYEKYVRDLGQRVVDIFHSQKSCQVTSFGGSENTAVENLKSSILPMAIVKKQISDIYLSEFKKKPKK